MCMLPKNPEYFSEWVDIATVAMVTELGHVALQMVFIHSCWEGQSAEKGVCEDDSYSTNMLFSYIISLATVLLSHMPFETTTLWLILESTCICLQVLDWIENHGEAFLSKHTGVGKSLHRARALQKRHEDFEDVAQVTVVLC